MNACPVNYRARMLRISVQLSELEDVGQANIRPGDRKLILYFQGDQTEQHDLKKISQYHYDN